MDHFEKFEEQLLNSYESTLAVEGEEICKEVESSISISILISKFYSKYLNVYLYPSLLDDKNLHFFSTNF